MKLRILPSTIADRIFAAALALASFAVPSALVAQNPATPAPAQTPAPQSTDAPVTGNTTITTGPDGKPQTSVDVTFRNKSKRPPKAPRAERAKQTKDVKQEVKKQDKFNALAGKDQSLPDK